MKTFLKFSEEMLHLEKGQRKGLFSLDLAILVLKVSD